MSLKYQLVVFNGQTWKDDSETFGGWEEPFDEALRLGLKTPTAIRPYENRILVGVGVYFVPQPDSSLKGFVQQDWLVRLVEVMVPRYEVTIGRAYEHDFHDGGVCGRSYGYEFIAREVSR